MYLRLTRDFRGWRSGHIFTQMPDGVAQLLIRRGVGVVDDRCDANPSLAEAETSKDQKRKPIRKTI